MLGEKIKLIPFLVIISFLFTSNIFSQDKTVDNETQADQLVQEKKYEEAAQLYEKVISDNPDNNFAIYKLANAYYSLENYDKAIANYLKIAQNKNPTVLYNLACTYSLAGMKDESLKYLKEAVDNGFTNLSSFKTDTDLENVRNDERFMKIQKSIKALENYPEASKFDFWVGEWNVYNPQNQKAGESKIEKILKGAVILENWYGGTGFVGKSFNHFDMDKEKWIQYWINQNSQTTYFEGNYDESQKAIVYYSYDHAKDENPYIRRLRFFNLGPNKVRQWGERSTDNGKTWSTEYDFTYLRKGSE